MSGFRLARSLLAYLSTAVIVVGACGSGQPTPAPTTSPAATSTATGLPTGPSPTAPEATASVIPGCVLDPGQGDAGVVGCVSLANDIDGHRDGTYSVIGVAADGSTCGVSFDATEFIAVAWNTSVPDGQLARLSVSLPAASVPQADAAATGISGRVSFEFAGAQVGSTYTGDASQNDGESTIDVRLAAARLTFDFSGRTARDASFSGQIVCALTGPNPSTPGAGGETPIIAFSDPSTLDQDSWDAQLPLLELACRQTQPQEQPSFESAMAGVRSWLDSATGGGLSALEASGEFADEAIASAGAAELATGGDFAGALALTLQALRAEPGDPRHLVNASALLVTLGRPGDAIAFQEQAATMGAPDVTPMGIDQAAVMSANRGLALSAQGRFSDAAAALRSAANLDGNLTEASDNLAQTEVCQGRGSAAFAVVRQPRKDQLSRIPAGQPGTLPDLKLPARPADTVPLSELYQRLVDDSIGRLMARMERRTQLAAESQTRYSQPASLARVQSIQSLIGLVEGRPDVQALWAQVVTRGNEVDRITFDMWEDGGAAARASDECANTSDYNGCFRAWCVPETQQRHAQWRGAFDSYETALRDAYALTSQRQNALAALVADPVWFEIVSLDLQDRADVWFYSYLTGKALGWSRMVAVQGSDCIEGESEDASPAPEEPAPDAVPCDAQSFPNGLMPTVRFPGAKATLTIGANCEEIKVEISGPGIDRLGLLKPFAQVKSTGKGLTIFAGVKAGLTMEPANLSSKLGAYWTVDYQGNVMDYGVRVAPGSASLESGPFGVRVWEAQAMDFSFVGITDYMPLIGTK